MTSNSNRAIRVFDTETICLNKPFCYNVGYVIYDVANDRKLARRDFVVEQVWHNPRLFETAYYANKRPLYVKRRRGRATQRLKWGTIRNRMLKDIETYNVVAAYAFNSDFDVKVFDFNCNKWFHTRNPFDTLPVYDIRKYACAYLANDYYFEFCEQRRYTYKDKFFTAKNNYKTTAESFYCAYCYDESFNEEHTAASDSDIELEILKLCLHNGAHEADDELMSKKVPLFHASVPSATL